MGLPEPITRPTETEAARTRDLFDEYGRMVLVLCRALLRDRSDAEDAAQQTFLAAYRGLLAGQQPRQPAAWLATIARNECRARRRNGDDLPVPFEVEVEAAYADPAEIAAARAELAALRDALAELPERQLEVVRLHCFDGLSYDEVAKTLEISSRAVDGLLVRARNRLRRRVADLTRAGALVAPDSVRDRLAQLIPGFEPGGSAVAAGGGAGGLAALGSGSAPLTAKLAVATTVGVAALGSGGAGPPFTNQHAARARTPPLARTEPVRRDTPQAQLRAAVVTKGQENRGRSGGEGERRRGSSGPGHNGRGSGQGHDDEPSEPLTPSDNSGPGSAGSGSAGSGSSTSGSSGSSSASSGSSGHGSSGSGKSGSGFDSSGSGSGGPEEPD